MPAINPIGLRYHQARVFLLIFAIVTSAYLLTYRARIESGDTLRAMDALTSQSRFGDWLMDESTWFKPPLRVRDYHNLPLSNFDVEERLQLNLALPLLQLAEFLPRMGNIHAVWLFNILVTALMAGLIYLILRAFGYADMVGIAVALSAAFATNLWAYSQTFFRESLTGCFLLLALYLLQGSRYRSVLPRVIGVIAGFAALYLAVETKSSAIVALPAIVVFALPRLRFPGTVSFSDFSRILLSGLLISLLVLAFIEPVADALHGLYPGLNPKQNYLSYALRVFLFSPGGSLWGTSPLLLLAIAGAVVLLRQGKHRLVWAICLLTAAYALAHALTTGAHWFGGLSWPPRFLFPVIPVAMLATAPIAEKIVLERNRRLTLVWVVLLAYGIWIQFSAVSLESGSLWRNAAVGSDATFGMGTRSDESKVLSLGSLAITLVGSGNRLCLDSLCVSGLGRKLRRLWNSGRYNVASDCAESTCPMAQVHAFASDAWAPSAVCQFERSI